MTNKRIVELREQAFSECKRYDDDCGDYLVKTNEVFDKFAELIVKECQVALSPMLRDMISRGQAYNLIKEHFGVE